MRLGMVPRTDRHTTIPITHHSRKMEQKMCVCTLSLIEGDGHD